MFVYIIQFHNVSIIINTLCVQFLKCLFSITFLISIVLLARQKKMFGFHHTSFIISTIINTLKYLGILYYICYKQLCLDICICTYIRVYKQISQFDAYRLTTAIRCNSLSKSATLLNLPYKSTLMQNVNNFFPSPFAFASFSSSNNMTQLLKIV